MQDMKHRALKQRFYPNQEQVETLAKTFGCARFVYNNLLKQRTDTFHKDGVSVSYNQASKMLTALKRNPEYAWLKDVSSVPLQQAIRNQQTAFKHFFAKRAKYPSFKKKQSKQSMQYMKTAFEWNGECLTLAKMKQALKIKWSYDKPEKILSLTISKDSAERYFVSMLVEFEPKYLPVTPKMVGVDLGIKDQIVTSDGFKSGALKLTNKYADQLAYLQCKLSQKEKGSRNGKKVKLKIAKLHAKIKDTRLDRIHKLTRMLVNENQVIAIEDLNVRGMMANRKLSKAIADVSMFEIRRQLEYKGDWSGRSVPKVDRFYPSSKRMSCCGHVVDKLLLSQRTVVCPVCHIEHDRDINAAINILAAGTAVLASGATGTGTDANATV
jgi:putative transposase